MSFIGDKSILFMLVLLIAFVSEHVFRSSIAVDTVVRWQIYGLTNLTFQNLLTWDNPVSGQVNAQLILASQGTEAHIASGRDRILYNDYVRTALKKNSILYTNGKSYLLLNFTAPAFALTAP